MVAVATRESPPFPSNPEMSFARGKWRERLWRCCERRRECGYVFANEPVWISNWPTADSQRFDKTLYGR